MKVQGLGLRGKMKEVDVRMEELEVDVGVVEGEGGVLVEAKGRLMRKIALADVKYHDLINKNK